MVVGILNWLSDLRADGVLQTTLPRQPKGSPRRPFGMKTLDWQSLLAPKTPRRRRSDSDGHDDGGGDDDDDDDDNVDDDDDDGDGDDKDDDGASRNPRRPSRRA